MATESMDSKERRVIRQAGRILAGKPHDYVRDPASGAGNCWCGAWEAAPIHATQLGRGTP